MDDHLGALQRVEAGGAVAQVVIGGANRPHLRAELLEQGDRRASRGSRAPPVTATDLPDQKPGSGCEEAMAEG